MVKRDNGIEAEETEYGRLGFGKRYPPLRVLEFALTPTAIDPAEDAQRITPVSLIGWGSDPFFGSVLLTIGSPFGLEAFDPGSGYPVEQATGSVTVQDVNEHPEPQCFIGIGVDTEHFCFNQRLLWLTDEFGRSGQSGW